MRIKGTIYLFAPMEKDLENHKDLREHLSRPTSGRLFLEATEGFYASFPFSSISKLTQILHQVRLGELEPLTKKLVSAFNGTKELEKRRCLRISIEDINPEHDPMKYVNYAGGKVVSRAKYYDFSLDSTGVLKLLDADLDYKYGKMYFTDFFDAGVKLAKAFAAEVNSRISLEEENEN